MFSNERIKYDAPLPGEEFKTRDLSVPAEATKILFEIDSQHGEDKELCLTILSRIFRGTDTVTKILHECTQNFQGGVTEGASWRFQATVTRNIRMAKIETQLNSLTDKIKGLEKEVVSLQNKKQETEYMYPFFTRGTYQTPTRNLHGEFQHEAKVREGEGQPESPSEERIRKFNLVLGKISVCNSQITVAQKERDALIEENSLYKADPKNNRFSKTEEEEAKAKFQKKRERRVRKEPGKNGWEKF